MKVREPIQVLVTGDIALDKNIYEGLRKKPEDDQYGTQIIEEKGGAYLIYELVSKLTELYKIESKIFNDKVQAEIKKLEQKVRKTVNEKEIEALQAKIEEKKNSFKNYYKPIFGLKKSIFDLGIEFPSCLETYANWKKCKYDIPDVFQKVLGEKIQTWKVSMFLGLGTEKNKTNDKICKESELVKKFYQKYRKELGKGDNPKILVFDDGGNNYRNDKPAWEELLYDKSESKEGSLPKKAIDYIIVKMAFPLAQGELFKALIKDFSDKLIIIVSIDEIRKEDVLISKGVSWEQTALDLINELSDNQSVKRLLKCKNLLINFQSEGVLYVEMDNKKINKCRLVFDPEYLEGEWTISKKIEGDIIGAMSCFTSAIVYGLLGNNLNMETTIIQALSAMRHYKILGHGTSETSQGFPVDSICQEILKPKSKYASAFVPIPHSGLENIVISKDGYDNEVESTCFHNLNWSILEGNYRLDSSGQPLYDTGCRFALLGDGELANTPVLKMKNFVTYDRREIESLRNIINLAKDYIESKKTDKPLSIGVFGSPGSGKSFAVKQFSKFLSLEPMEFNLSQFVDVHELEGAFHKVRDKVLTGETPVVFWDEFDSQAYRWLQYLLAPMQDGKFQEGQITHPIGRCIFVFAGATSYTFQTFGVKKPVYPDPSDPQFAEKKIKYKFELERHKDFILKKGPDFKSRLSGYLNVKGPNQLECLNEYGDVKEENGNPVYDKDDIFFPIRRAMFIRNILGARRTKLLNIDHGLLNALIKIDKYKHGCRSLSQILSSLKSKSNSRVQRSNLLTYNVLSMLLNYNAFIGFLSAVKTIDFVAYKIASEIHTNWMKIGDDKGWKLEYHKDYNYLPAHLKEENIAAARRINEILNIVGLMIVREEEKDFYTVVDKDGYDAILKESTNLEDLSKAEHQGWYNFKDSQKWIYGSNRNDDRKLHNCQCPWNKLSVKDQNKDKDAIINYPEVLKAAGYVIVKKK